MATYNGERFLREQMDSILSQTYKNIEVVACDDCSTDSTWQILQEYAHKDGRVRCFKNEANLGFKKNFEKAISLCKGEFIALSDQDDIWLKEKLEKQLDALNGQNSDGKRCDIACCEAELIDENSKPLHKKFKKDIHQIEYIPKDKKKQFSILMLFNFVQGATILAKAQFLKQCLPVPDFHQYHDWWFAQNAAAQNGIFYISKPLILYRSHSSQQTGEKKGASFIWHGTKESLSKNIERNLAMLNGIMSSLQLSEEYLQIVKDAAKHTEHKKYKDWVYLYYIFRNCGVLCLTRNPLKKAVFLLKKTCGCLFRRKLCEKKGR